MRVLLTGCHGFIGRNVNDVLMETKGIKSVICIEKDYMNYDGWKSSLVKAVQDCDVVIHIGAISDTMLQDVNEMMYYNFWLSKQIFDIASQYNKKVIYSSSAACYGTNRTFPSNLYGWSKYLAEQYGISNNKKFVALRYFNVYGPGEENKGKMASIAYQAWKHNLLTSGEKPFKLFPKNPKRDFVFVDDVVSANIHAIESESGVYEVGSGVANSFETVMECLKLKYEYVNEINIPKGYQFYTCSTKSRWMNGWCPEYNIEYALKSYRRYLIDE